MQPMHNTENNHAVASDDIEFEGLVKWFDVEKKHGFLHDEELDIDIYIPYIVLLKFGIFALKPNDFLAGKAVKNDKGMIVEQIIQFEPEGIVYNDETAETLIHENKLFIHKEKSDDHELTIAYFKSYFPSRGYGFFTCPKLKSDIFFKDNVFTRSNLNADDLEHHRRYVIEYEQDDSARYVAVRITPSS
jgi:cold shock CspA family protein